MCAISGIFNLDGQPVDGEALRKMTRTMKHRGPDGEGYFVKSQVGLGHRRLSIIDLEGGSQPIGNEDGSIQIVFNGEVYNFVELRADLEKRGHKFATRSDTEVIVHAYEEWGDECVQKFIGMFAFAIWDAPKQRLFIARDHLGVKPLYYIQLGPKLIFASEIKALLQEPGCPREVDLKSLAQLCSFRYVPSPATLFSRIQKLPPGYTLAAANNGISVKRFWNWIPRRRSIKSFDEAVDEYRSLLDESIRLQLRSDVPLGVFLSSGIDSASILAIMRQYVTGDIQAVTIGFEDGEKTDEVKDAARIAKQFGAEHSYNIVKADEYADYYNRYIWDLEEPVGNETAAAFYFVSALGHGRFKVALTGQGADEPWAGYPRHLGARISEYYSKLPAWCSQKLVPALANRFSSNEQVQRAAWSLGEKDMLTRLMKIYSFFSGEMQDALYQDSFKKAVGFKPFGEKDALRLVQQDVDGCDPLTQILYIDVRGDLPDDLLMVADKTSMANSLELRVPFLDHRLVEYVEALPNHFKLRGLKAKYLHKVALEKWLPREMIYRKKKGFANPMRDWMRTRMRNYICDHLLSSDAAVSQYFNQDYIRSILDLHYAQKGDFMRQIELLLSFELWHRAFITR
jgi:asparagine synthase (glutamine-hydrolysing)